jgi:hypothetical protein
MRNVLDKFVGKIKTHILFKSFLISFIYEKMWKNMVQLDRQQLTLWRTRIACWIPKATNTHSEYVILIVFSTEKMVAPKRLNVT